MTQSTPPTDPDALAILHAFSSKDLSTQDAYNALGALRSMIGKNVDAAFEVQNAKFDAINAKFDAINTKIDAFNAKIDAFNASVDTKIDAFNAKIDTLQEHLRRERAMLWAVIALLGAAVLRYLLVG